jgi:hypothetical protein
MVRIHGNAACLRIGCRQIICSLIQLADLAVAHRLDPALVERVVASRATARSASWIKEQMVWRQPIRRHAALPWMRTMV